jgi:nitrite reductase (NO-forming)
MNSEEIEERRSKGWLVVAAAGVRVAFGILMAVDAYLKWQSAFAAHYVGYLQNAANSQPFWLAPWFNFWLRIVTPHTGSFVLATRLIETAIAAGLLLGVARRIIYVVGALFSLLIWSTAEGFGGPYTSGATNLGPALVYALVFIAAALFERLLGPSPYSLDCYIARRFPGWASFAEWAPRDRLRRQTPPLLDWDHQFAVIGAVVVTLVFALATLDSATKGAAPTPRNAAAAVSPLSVASAAPVIRSTSALLPPLISDGDTAAVTLTATDSTIQIASDVQYNAWTFGGTVPGPTLHVRQGQTVNVTFVNNGTMDHSIDFHAAQIAPDVAYRSILPHQQIQFSFVAAVPGAFVYHCGTPPVLQHIGNGMYGAIIVDPLQPLPVADQNYVIVQGEWYTQQVSGTLMSGDYQKMLSVAPDEVVFNGVAFQYKDHPLPAKIGQRVRLYVVDAGPNLPSAFHIIGGMFAAVYPDADMNHALSGVSTYAIAPGQGAILDAIISQPGQYPFVDHSMRDMMIGAMGLLNVTQ